jgi:hypothetical protein
MEIDAAGVELIGDVTWAAELLDSAEYEDFGWFLREDGRRCLQAREHLRGQ